MNTIFPFVLSPSKHFWNSFDFILLATFQMLPNLKWRESGLWLNMIIKALYKRELDERGGRGFEWHQNFYL
jgi:hypothetical protein